MILQEKIQNKAKEYGKLAPIFLEGAKKVTYCHTSPEVCEYIRATNTYSLRDKASAF